MIVGLTGGIGSGKTTAAGYFKKLGIPVYIADERAKLLMNTSKKIIVSIQELLGDEAYTNEGLNKKYVAEQVFTDKNLLASLNAIVHPAVDQDFQNWYKTQKAPYSIKEAAILFENGGYKKCDFMIVVTAPLDLRVQRVSKRDNLTKEEVLQRVKNQWTDAKKISLSDAIIENNSLSSLESSVARIHNHLTVRASRDW